MIGAELCPDYCRQLLTTTAKKRISSLFLGNGRRQCRLAALAKVDALGHSLLAGNVIRFDVQGKAQVAQCVLVRAVDESLCGKLSQHVQRVKQL